MKFWSLFVALFVCVGTAVAADQPAAKSGVKAEKTYYFTDTQLKAYVAGEVAKALAERDQNWDVYFERETHAARNWHTAVYGGVKHHIYTGPGQLATCGNVEPPKEVQPTKPTTGQVNPVPNQPTKISALEKR